MSTINFNVAYGDISLNNNEILKLESSDEDVIQCIHTLLKTEENDYRLRPNYGIDFQKWFGRHINIELAEAIKYEIISKMNDILQIKNRRPEIYYILGKNEIIYRIIVQGIDSVNFSFVKDKGVKVVK